MIYLNNIQIQNWKADSTGSTITAIKSSGGVIGTQGGLNDGDYILNLAGRSSDGSSIFDSGRLTLVSSGGSIGAGFSPGRWEFYINNTDDGTESLGAVIGWNSNIGDSQVVIGSTALGIDASIVGSSAGYGVPHQYMLYDGSGVSAQGIGLGISYTITPKGTGSIILNGKSVVSGVLSTQQNLSMTEISAPSSPSAGILDFYAKSDHNLYIKNSSGVETRIATTADITSSGGFMPYNILTNTTFTIPVNYQAIMATKLTNNGLLNIQGILIGI